MKATGGDLTVRRGWWWLVLVLAPIAMMIILDLAAVALVPPSPDPWGWKDPFSWKELTAGPDRPRGAVRITFRIKRQVLRATYHLTLPKSSGLVGYLGSGGASEGQYLAHAIGEIVVNNVPLVFEPPMVTMREGEADVTVSLDSKRRPLLTENSYITISPFGFWDPARPNCCVLPVRVVVETDGARVFSIPPPTAQSPKQTVLPESVNGVGFSVLLHPFKPNRGDSTAKAVPGPQLDPSQLSHWRQLISQDAGPPGRVQLAFTVKDQRVTATYDLSLPVASDSPVVTDKQNLLDLLRSDDEAVRDAARDPEDLTRFLGSVMVASRPLVFKPPSIDVADGAQDARVAMTSEPFTLRQEQLQVVIGQPIYGDCCFRPTRVIVKTEGARVTEESMLVSSRSATETVFAEVSEGLRFDLHVSPFDEKRARAQHSLLKTLFNFEVRGFSWMLYWFVVSLPALAFILWLRRWDPEYAPARGVTTNVESGDGAADGVTAEQVAKLLLAFSLIAMVVAGAADLMEVLSPAAWLAELLRRLEKWPWPRPTGWTGGPAVMLIALAVIWPRMVRPATGSVNSRRVSTTASMVLGEAALAAGIILLIVNARPKLPRGAGLPTLSGWGIATLAVTSLLLTLLLWLVLTALNLRTRLADRLIALLMLLTFPILYALYEDQRPESLLRGAIITIASVLVLKALLELGHSSLQLHPHALQIWQKVAARLPGWILVTAGAAVILVLAVPTYDIFKNASIYRSAVNGWSMMRLSDWLVHVFAALLGVAALSRLRVAAARNLSVFHPRVKALGVLFAVAILFDPFNHFGPIHVPLIAGSALFAGWLLVGGNSSSARRQRSLLDSHSREELLTQAVQTDQAATDHINEPAAAAPNRWAFLGDWLRHDHSASGSQANQASDIDIQDIRSVTMSMGPTNSSWEDGKLFAGYSLWLSLPWVLLYFVPSTLGLWLRDTDYQTLGAIVAITWNTIQWPALGFFLGYFYPAIRGHNGLWKGLSTAIAFIVPWFLVELGFWIVEEQDSWQPFIVWAVQVFVTSVLTGFLAGELATLGRAGYGWRQLTEVHNFKALAAWGSSIAIALGGAVVTLLTTTIGEVVTGQLTGGGPRPPTGP